MTEQTYALNAPCELVIDLTATAEETASLTFYKIPRLAMDQVGDVCIDWGDGVLEYIDCTLSEVELQRMARDATFTPVLRVAHRGLAEAVTRIRIRTTSGFLPLRALAHQTYAIVSPLPTLTVGQMDKNGKLLPTKRLLPLIEPDESGKTALTFVAGDLFINNPNLAVLDRAFYASRIRTVDAHLFDAIENPVSIREIFARSDLEVLPGGLLSHVGPNTVCTRAFADCHALKEVSDPFAGAPVPFVVDAFLQAPRTQLLRGQILPVALKWDGFVLKPVPTTQPFASFTKPMEATSLFWRFTKPIWPYPETFGLSGETARPSALTLTDRQRFATAGKSPGFTRCSFTGRRPTRFDRSDFSIP